MNPTPNAGPPSAFPSLLSRLGSALWRLLKGWLKGYLPETGLVVLGGAMLALLAWGCFSYAPDTAGSLSRARIRQTKAEIAANLSAVALDTPKARAALSAGRLHLDTAKAHAHRALHFHQQTAAARPQAHAHHSLLFKRRPTARPRPAASLAAEQLQRQLADYAAGH